MSLLVSSIFVPATKTFLPLLPVHISTGERANCTEILEENTARNWNDRLPCIYQKKNNFFFLNFEVTLVKHRKVQFIVFSIGMDFAQIHSQAFHIIFTQKGMISCWHIHKKKTHIKMASGKQIIFYMASKSCHLETEIFVRCNTKFMLFC